MTIDSDAILSHMKAVTHLLLGNRQISGTIAITGGPVLDIDRRLWLAKQVVESRVDLVHAEFTSIDGGVTQTGMTLFAARDPICYVQTGCRLWLSKAGNRAVILPQPSQRGCFHLSPRELIHVDREPRDRTEGIAPKRASPGGCASPPR